MKNLLLTLRLPTAALLLAGCIYTPRTTTVYDQDCQITARHMQLEVTQLEGFGHCRNEGCVALLAAAGAVSAASVVVSGSIVVAGNVVYWFERRGQCNRAPGALNSPPQAP
jgi:hypothetical protein